jgi:hypothetical protein
MSMLNWMTKKAPPPGAADSTPAETHPGSRRGERAARREQLYTVIRDCMVTAGVLSSSYRFKVLSLDGWGRQFLVMIDLHDAGMNTTSQLTAVEGAIARAAKLRHDIGVKAVYWRQSAVAGKDEAQVAKVIAKPQAGTLDETVRPDELAAFRDAITGYEDTEQVDSRLDPALGTTQYGGLR